MGANTLLLQRQRELPAPRRRRLATDLRRRSAGDIAALRAVLHRRIRQRDEPRHLRAQLQHAQRRPDVALPRRIGADHAADGQPARRPGGPPLPGQADRPGRRPRHRSLGPSQGTRAAGNRRHPADPRGAHRLPAGDAPGPRPAHAAVAAGHADEGCRRLRQALLARGRAERHRAVAERPRQRDLRRLAARRQARGRLRIRRRGRGAQVHAPFEIEAPRPSSGELQGLLRCPGREAARILRNELDPRGMDARLPGGGSAAGDPRGIRPRAAKADRAYPLGGHRDLDLLERLHGWCGALGRARGQGDPGRAVRRRTGLDGERVRNQPPAPARSGHGWFRTATVAALATMLACAALPALAAKDRPRWDTRVLALVGKPGFPARAYVAPSEPGGRAGEKAASGARSERARPLSNGRIYEGTYENPLGGHQPSRVREYTGNGTLLHSWSVPGQDLSGGQGVQVATSDAHGRLVLLDRDPARVLLFDPSKHRDKFRVYASFPDLEPCQPGATAPDCSPTIGDEPAVPNYAAWGRDGSLYVTDYLQAVIWRVPPGGGKPRVWLADHRLDGNQFGTTGIVLEPDHRTLLVMQQSSAGGGDGNPTTGKLYSVRIRAHARPGPLHRIWESGPVEGPDGFWVARSGRIYAALAGSNQIAVIGPDGSELGRFPATPQTGDNSSPVPFDTPSSVMFKGTRLIVANQSFFGGDPTHQAILDVEAGERGEPEFIPRRAGLRPRSH